MSRRRQPLLDRVLKSSVVLRQNLRRAFVQEKTPCRVASRLNVRAVEEPPIRTKTL